jgi:lysophospholipase L1-like esterase
MKKLLTVIAVNFMLLSSIIIGWERVCQFAYLAVHGDLLFRSTASIHRQLFEIHPYLAGRPKAAVKVEKDSKIITTIDDHTRWTGAEKDDKNLIRIAVLGGSSTFCTGVTDKNSWPALLQKKLGKRYAVINYGVPGYSTAENIIQMAMVIPEKRPHLVIFYEGLNDIKNYHEKNFTADYYAHGFEQYGNLGIPVLEPPYRMQSLSNICATAWFVDRLRKIIAAHKKYTPDLSNKPDPLVDKIYKRNLHKLKVLSSDINAFAIYIPQVLNYAEYSGDKTSHVWTRHIKDEAMPTLMAGFNALMNEVCSSEEDNCLVLDEVLNQKWRNDDFVDECHFSPKGGDEFAEIIARAIAEIFKSNKPDSNTGNTADVML